MIKSVAFSDFLKPPEQCICCTTEEQAKQVCAAFLKHNKTWHNQMSYTHTCYDIGGPIIFYTNEGTYCCTPEGAATMKIWNFEEVNFDE